MSYQSDEELTSSAAEGERFEADEVESASPQFSASVESPTHTVASTVSAEAPTTDPTFSTTSNESSTTSNEDAEQAAPNGDEDDDDEEWGDEEWGDDDEDEEDELAAQPVEAGEEREVGVPEEDLSQYESSLAARQRESAQAAARLSATDYEVGGPEIDYLPSGQPVHAGLHAWEDVVRRTARAVYLQGDD